MPGTQVLLPTVVAPRATDAAAAVNWAPLQAGARGIRYRHIAADVGASGRYGHLGG